MGYIYILGIVRLRLADTLLLGGAIEISLFTVTYIFVLVNILFLLESVAPRWLIIVMSFSVWSEHSGTEVVLSDSL